MTAFRPRIIPVLLLKNRGLVKSKAFKAHRYIGEPINAVKIFNDLKADEVVFLDTEATREGRLVSLDFVADVGSEARMPFAVGGGITSVDDARRVIAAGAEKVVLGSVAATSPALVSQISRVLGASSVTVCVDVRKSFFRGSRVYSHSGTRSTGYDPVEYAQHMENLGAGELIVQSVERDGMRAGYDLELVQRVSAAVTIPVVALGGAGSMADLKAAYDVGYASGLAAGSLFVFHGPRQGVLLSYPDRSEVGRWF